MCSGGGDGHDWTLELGVAVLLVLIALIVCSWSLREGFW